MGRLVAVVLADGRDGDDVALVAGIRQGRAMDDLEAFGILDAGRKAAREVRRDMVAAE